MQKADVIWAGLLGVVTAGLLVPSTHEMFIQTTRAHPYVMGFCKVGLLATMGELLAVRISARRWQMPIGLPWRFLVWGAFGVAFALVFDLFATGTQAVLEKGLLPALPGGRGLKLSQAFWTSVLMNGMFAPAFMALHRVTDGFIERGHGEWRGMRAVRLTDVVSGIDWAGFVGFVLLITIPAFWIPAHTVTFLLPPEYRVLMASYLSIALGAILAYAKGRKKTETGG